MMNIQVRSRRHNIRSKPGLSVAGGGAAAAPLTFTADQDTITPSITLDAGAPSPDWLVVEGDGSEFTYSTASISHTRTDPGPVVVTLRNSAALVGFLTGIDFRSDGITSTLADLSLDQFADTLTILYLNGTSVSGDISAVSNLTSLTQLWLYNTSVSGDISAVSNLTSLTNLRLNGTSVSGDISAVSNLTSLTQLWLYNTSVSGDISAVSNLTSLAILYLNGTSVSGDISAVSNLTSLTDLRLNGTSVSGDISAVSNLTSLTILWLHNTSVGYDGASPALSPLAALNDFQIQDCALTQAEVDAVLFDAYDGADTRTATGGSINVGGSNAAPSGTHQAAASCPVTDSTPGKEIAWELVNDSCAAGITVWSTVTFTA